MPIQFYQHLSKLRKRAYWNAVIALLLVVSPCIAIALIQINPYLSVIQFGLFVIVLIAFCSVNKKVSKPNNGPWLITTVGIREVIQKNSFIEILPNVFFFQQCYKRISIRLLTQFVDTFSVDMVSQKRNAANKKANRMYGHAQKVSIYEASRSLRINIVVCKDFDKKLIDWVERSNQTVHRAESIINIAYIEECNQLVIPFLYGQFDVSEIKRFTLGIEYILSLLPT